MKMGIKMKMSLTMFILISIPIYMLGSLSYEKAKEILIEELNAANLRTIEHMNDYFIHHYMEEIELAIDIFSSDQKLLESLTMERDVLVGMDDWNIIRRLNSDLWHVFIGTSNGRFYIVPEWQPPDRYDPSIRPWYIAAMKEKGKIVWSEPYEELVTHEKVISASKTIEDHNGEVIGVFAINTSLQQLSKAVKGTNLGEGGFVMILDKRGQIIAHPDEDALGKDMTSQMWYSSLDMEKGAFYTIADGKGMFISYMMIPKTEWQLVALMPKETLEKEIEPIRQRTISIGVISGLAAVLVGIFFSHTVVGRIRRIMDYMEAVEKGDLQVQSYCQGNDEIAELNMKFNHMVANLHHVMSEMKKISMVDGLTKVYNHKYMYDRLDQEIKEARRYGKRLSVIMVDIDHFKAVNDKYGHQVGDQVLSKLAAFIRNSLRSIDIVGRYGGEEFMIILPETMLEQSFILADKIRQRVECLQWQEEELKITISGGVTEWKDENALEIVKKADDLLYKAKNNGRNRIEK
ncbi:diguanylate cyclase (GGDEF)-like protein [Anaerosolibacter carboniphilus]|uniref:Diguanylate cyclase (GGDEF)-like protein n=1 Tax=Anaerosolibacter carboniphilus TaxID=1417629 RepID=A0A841KLN0_9FIRM|nr:GGDEF domain-containing protein [Anaerosolibacter carboniphilus]MBB6214734.1 diguanylate cyclase (GGDEF)-like protein [Anaerosolibacter carboniphilus]